MAPRFRFPGRRAAGTDLAAPRPDTTAVAINDDRGDLGGPTAGGYVQTRTARAATLLSTTKVTTEVIRAMREHPQVSACLTVQTLPMVRAGWTVECDDDDIRENASRWWGHIAAEVMRSAARAAAAGYSPNVLVWDVDPTTGGLMVRKIRDLDPPTCKVSLTDSGDYGGFVQHEHRPEEERFDGVDEDGRERVLQTLWLVEGMESGNLYGRSMLTPARQAWQDQQALNLFHLRGLERFAYPVTVARAPDQDVVANQGAINAALAANAAGGNVEVPAPVLTNKLADTMRAAEGLANGSTLGLPSERALVASGDGVKDVGYVYDVTYLESTRGAGDLLEAIREKDRQIARAMLVPSLLIEGGTSVGSNALGQSHKDTFTSNAEARLADYAGQITRHLFSRFVDFNYGENAPRAVLKFAPLADDDREQLWQLALALVGGGVIPVDAEAVAARLGIPVAELDEEAADDVAAAASNPFSSVGLPALVAARIISEAEARELLGIAGDPPPPAVAETALRFGRAGDLRSARYILGLRGSHHRPAVTATAGGMDNPPGLAFGTAWGGPLRDTVELAAPPADVTGMPEWQQPQAYDTTSGWRRELTVRESGTSLRRLEGAMNTAEAACIDKLAELLDASRGKVLRQVQGIMRRGGSVADIVNKLGTVDVGASGPYAAAWVELQRTLWGAGLDSVKAELTTFADLVPGNVGAAGLALVKQYASASADRVTADLASRVRLELLATYRSGVSPAGLDAAVSDLFDREVRGESRGPRLTTRMLASRAVNEGRADAITRGGIPLRGAQYSALLDKRTCELCERLDEQVIAIGDLDYAKFTPPIHHGCRCVWVFITTEEADFTPTWSAPPRSVVERFGSLIVG